MDDLISRRAAIEKMEMLYRDARDDTNYMLIGYNHALSDMQAILKSLPSAQSEQHLCRDCKWAKYYGNVDKNGNVESYWYCTNWYGGTDEEGYCHEWESR